MMRYLIWFYFLTLHKWHVFVECCKEGIVLRGILHDLDKYRPSQFFPYAKFHFHPDGSRINRRDATGHYDAFNTGIPEFEKSIFLHWRRSIHHWEAYVIPYKGGYKVFPMSDTTIKEMICDWKGASKTSNNPDIHLWWEKNKVNMILHDDTRRKIEEIMGGK